MKFEEYVRLGLDLKELNEQLCVFLSKTSKKNKKSSPIMKLADRTMKELTGLRSDLEDLMYFEHPDSLNLLASQTFPDAKTHIFYGPTKFNFNVQKGVWESERKTINFL